MEFSPDAKRVFHVQTYGGARTIEGVRVIELTRHLDDGGAMTELARLADGHVAGLGDFTMRQVNYSEMTPGTIKAFHLHARQTDVWFVPPSDHMLAVLLDVRNGASRLLFIPAGVAHGVRNLADTRGRIIYFTDVYFSPDPATCDEGRLPWDFAGQDVWEVTRG